MSYQLLMEKSDYPGFLITFCGIDGCGKSTMINMLQKQLIELGHSVILTKQPTDLVRKSKIFRTFMDSPDTSKYDYQVYHFSQQVIAFNIVINLLNPNCLMEK